ncbi:MULTISPECIES: hypothetical protein [Mycobacteriaceae]|uniref:Uncharacterized protein n=1 Tax=Mycolicibacterium neoaurum VKM Ac-1815D TaxID=700508 RepID=V5XIM5_MYCNE|nr:MULTISPECIES: hypothetical protein [Mycobacteriaceae]AHC27897.1 hypothetical protein D174_09665 [Mycolicibacterium neoaurum VKM Ac-1815D]AMO05377.1 hypothetical protein MyAD_09475 [Mycolicibacterium neoaurum]AXK76309.1 hypothetical protein DXK33_15575 [Mycolicibacterium neoaurum]KJQ50778.1 hypothetical protein TS71_09290 [Mycolicibacterium neoaurum]KUM09971.1 hypothetical protein AVZ31_03815 [Mycolicibacterium neoaurum]
MWTLALIVVVAAAAAAGGYAVGRRSQTRTRRVFLVGFLFGSVAGAPVRRRLMRLVAARRSVVRGPVRPLIAAQRR